RRAALGAGKAAGEHVEQEADAEALVCLRAAERPDRAARLFVKHARVGRGPALRVEQPALGRRLSLVEADAHLALGTDAGADVENDGLAARGSTEAERVGADAAVDAAGRRHAAAEAVAVHRGDQGHALSGSVFRVRSEEHT